MTASILDGKRILAVDDESDVLKALGEEILGACPKCKLDQATAHETAVKMLGSKNYDTVFLDIEELLAYEYVPGWKPLRVQTPLPCCCINVRLNQLHTTIKRRFPPL
jgi:hypothetical protein